MRAWIFYFFALPRWAGLARMQMAARGCPTGWLPISVVAEGWTHVSRLRSRLISAARRIRVRKYTLTYLYQCDDGSFRRRWPETRQWDTVTRDKTMRHGDQIRDNETRWPEMRQWDTVTRDELRWPGTFEAYFMSRLWILKQCKTHLLVLVNVCNMCIKSKIDSF